MKSANSLHLSRDDMESFLQSFDLTEADVVMIPIGTVLFFLFFRLLSTRLFIPLVTLLEERERRTTGAEDLSRELREKAQDVRNRIEVRASIAESQHQAERKLIVERARSEASKIIEAAESAASEIVHQSRGEIERECQQMRDYSLGRVEDIAREGARRIVEARSDFVHLQ